MLRQARLDVLGTLHHVIIRGIEKRKIVDDQKDRQEFVIGWAPLPLRPKQPSMPGR